MLATLRFDPLQPTLHLSGISPVCSVIIQLLLIHFASVCLKRLILHGTILRSFISCILLSWARLNHVTFQLKYLEFNWFYHNGKAVEVFFIGSFGFGVLSEKFFDKLLFTSCYTRHLHGSKCPAAACSGIYHFAVA
jgi:hypothetical protein